MFGTIHHIGYLTDDAARDVALYERVFGGKVAAQRDTPDQPLLHQRFEASG